MGRGSYGRLGLGDSTNHNVPQRVRFGSESENIKIRMVMLYFSVYYTCWYILIDYVIGVALPY